MKVTKIVLEYQFLQCMYSDSSHFCKFMFH